MNERKSLTSANSFLKFQKLNNLMNSLKEFFDNFSGILMSSNI